MSVLRISALFQPLLENDRPLLCDDANGISIDCRSCFRIEYDESREATDIEMFGCWLHAWILEGQGKPWHLAQVLVVQRLVLVP